MIGDENTIVIDSAHAGDNFIVVVDTVQANVNNAALGTTEATRYKETDNLTQSELLTVWRTVNVERDFMYIPGVDDVGNQLPFQFGDDYADQGILGNHLVSEFRRACIEVIEFTPNSNPSVAGDIVMDVTTLGNHL
ncbi:MAG: hypothetical protein LBT09_11240, partial [Planctomycetaceae bacterium]|nr:hypothetical protein [Planctomycetaceae bacterium]